MSIERTQHEDKALAALPAKCRSSAITVGWAAHDLCPKSQCHRCPHRQIIVERYDDRERLAPSTVTHPKSKFRFLPADDHLPTIGMSSLDGAASELFYVKRPSSREAVRRPLQHECRREYFGAPEHGHLARGKSWIDGERSPPNAGRRLQLSSPRNQRRRGSPKRLPHSLVDMSSSAARIPRRNRVDRGACSHHMLREIANPKQQPASLAPRRVTRTRCPSPELRIGSRSASRLGEHHVMLHRRHQDWNW
jgi:hypothetical protein